MSARQPAVSAIAAGVSFVDSLAAGLLDRTAGDPVALSDHLVLLPTRRACRALGEAFLRVADGRPLLLPRCVPLGDVDEEELATTTGDAGLAGEAAVELPPAIGPLRRRLLLARLIARWGETQAHPAGGKPTQEQSIRLADELASFLDEVETEGLRLDRLAGLVPEEYAAHWQMTLTFLGILTEAWPAILAEEGCIGPAERRRRLLEARARAWAAAPPHHPVIAAGSTGSIPATARLLSVVARLPRGEVVLSGLDREADDPTWRLIRDQPAHPQYGLARLLETLEIERNAVAAWPAAPNARALARGRLVHWALRPAEATTSWRNLRTEAGASDTALADLTRIDCPSPNEEARVVALILREALEVPGHTAALITPDRALARRVAADLARWGIATDDSAGRPLADTPVGGFLRLIANMAADQLAPLSLLAVLKHPLAACGMAPAGLRARARTLELKGLRGPRPAAGFAGIRSALRGSGEDLAELLSWLAGLEDRLEPFLALFRGRRQPLSALATAHVEAAEALAESDSESGADRLWAGEAGEVAAGFLTEMIETAADADLIDPPAYPGLFDSLMADRAVRPRYGQDPRLHIWGPLEARLQHADVVVLGGLNEGTWPAEAESGPWLSRPMRRDFGLSPPERRIGLAAHDFAQAFTASRVFLTRAVRVDGTPTVPSRWLLRLEALLQALDKDPALDRQAAAQWLAWAEALDQPLGWLRAGPPAPRPPIAARPRELSVTEIETWRRDPYALYAKRILGLRALDPLDADPGAAERGTLIHEALERFVKTWPTALPENAEAALIEIGTEVFRQIEGKPGAYAFWWPRFCRVARWMAEIESGRRADMNEVFAEVRGSLVLEAPGGNFTLTAKADRIERAPDGALTIVDYKTGAVPGPNDVRLGYAPQLPLEAAIAIASGFRALSSTAVAELAYWRLSGGRPPGLVRPLKEDAAALADAALDGLRDLVARFDDPETPYHAVPRPDRALAYSDYGHLARVKEWSAAASREAGD